MISINSVRNTVMYLLEKENNGYINPETFNAYCVMAQLDIFENIFYEYTNWLNKESRRLTNTEYSNIPKNLREQIDVFASYTTNSNFTYDSTNNLWNYSGSDFYRSGNLSLVNAQGKKIDIEETTKSELNRLVNLKLVSTTYPLYEKINNSFRIYPIVPSGYNVEMFYIRKPKDPKWTYINVSGNPIYNASASDKQDFELMPNQLAPLVMKILSYCGVSLREEQIVQVANSEEVKNIQKQN